MTAATASCFTRPHYCASATHIDVGANYATLQSCHGFAEWRSLLAEELRDVYNWEDAENRVACVSYSTRDNPNSFASNVDEKLFHTMQAFREACARCDELSEQVRTAQLEQTAQGEHTGTETRLTRRQRDAQNIARRELRLAQRQLADAEAARDHEAQKLRHARDMCTIRIYVK